MLSRLRVENFAVVEKVVIDFSPGLNIFTGETGAGKSILIDAISFFLKKRISDNAIRSGKDKLIVEALFVNRDEEFVLRRELGRNKSVSYINGEMVPFATLKEKAENLLNIYGQNEHIFLLQTANHRIYLDRFARNGERLQELSAISSDLKLKIKQMNDLETRKNQLAEKLDLINFQITEIEGLKMESEDDSKLEQRLKILTSSEEIMSRSQILIDHLHQGENSLYNQLSERLKDLEYLRKIYPELQDYHRDVLAFFNILPDLSAMLSTILNQIEYEEDELNSIQERLYKLNRLKSKHSLDLNGLLEKCRRLKQERDSLLNIGFSMEEIKQEIRDVLDNYRVVNEKIRSNRGEKGERLQTLVLQELAQLEMKRARFVVKAEEVEPDLDNFSERGTDKIEFYFSSNPGQEPGKIKDVVSGGELSRLMLVLKSIMEDEQSSTYIFDEIDSGIGGKTAQFVGEKLKKISRSNQVICISHLPQIVAFADRHFLIQKEFKEDQTFSLTSELNDEETIQEIARLMAGRDINDHVLAAARNLLAAARQRL